MILKHTFAISFLLLLFFKANAQEFNIWSLERCLQYAEDNNLTLKQFRYRRNTSEISLKEAKAARLPNLNASSGAGLSIGLVTNPVTDVLENITNSNFSLRASSSLPIFNGFQINNTIKQSDIDLRASELDIYDQQNTIYLNIAAQYLQILLNQELLEQSEIQVATTREQIERTTRLVEAGTVARNALFELQATLATNETEVIRNRSQLELAYLGLIQLLDLNPGDPFRIEKPVLEDIDQPLHPAASQGIYEYAEATQPSVEASELRIESAKKGIDIAHSNAYPSLSLNYNVDTRYGNTEGFVEDPFLTQLENNIGHFVSLGMTIPIYNRRQVRSGIERAEMNLKDAQLQARIARQQLRQNIEQAYLDAVNSYSQYQQVLRQIESLDLNFENAEKQFNVGLINSVDFVLAQNNLQRAELDRIRFKYQYIFNVKVLDFYQGESLGF